MVQADDRGEVDHLLHLLKHGIRRDLLPAFANGPTSANEAAEATGRSLSSVSYHTKELYAEGRGLLQRIRERKVRGATETFYQLKPWGERTTLRSGTHSPHMVAQLEIVELLIESIASGEKSGEEET